jgi:hypothetical protein
MKWVRFMRQSVVNIDPKYCRVLSGSTQNDYGRNLMCVVSSLVITRFNPIWKVACGTEPDSTLHYNVAFCQKIDE